MIELITKAGGSISGSELVRASRKFGRVGDAEQALGELAEAGVGEWLQPPQQGRGKPPARRLVLGVNDVNVYDKAPGNAVSGNIVDIDNVDSADWGVI